MGGLTAQALQTLEVTGEDVDFQIDAIAAAQAAQRGDIRRVRDQVQVEIARAIGVVVERIDGERHAIDRDRALGGDVGRDFCRGRDLNVERSADFFAACHMADGIDVPGDDMAAQFVAQI